MLSCFAPVPGERYTSTRHIPRTTLVLLVPTTINCVAELANTCMYCLLLYRTGTCNAAVCCFGITFEHTACWLAVLLVEQSGLLNILRCWSIIHLVIYQTLANTLSLQSFNPHSSTNFCQSVTEPSWLCSARCFASPSPVLSCFSREFILNDMLAPSNAYA